MEDRLQIEQKVLKTVIARAKVFPNLKGNKVLSLPEQQLTDNKKQLALVPGGL